MTKVLFLHGSSAGPRSIKRQRLDAQPDFVVNCPQLPFPDHRPSTKAEWAAWLIPAITAIPRAQAIAQKSADEFDPDVIVGSSLGGAIVIGVRSRAARVLIAPATSVRLKEVVIPNFFVDKTIGARVVILHAEEDEIVPFEASRQLLTSDMLRYFPGQEAMLTMIQDDLVKAGYDVRDGRLIRIGADHQCNTPKINDSANANPDPLNAMVQAVRILVQIPE